MTTTPTDAQMKLARECAAKAYRDADQTDALAGYVEAGEMDDDEAVQSALLAIQATEARMAAAVEAERERCAALADNHSFALDIDEWMKMTKKEISAYACRSVAAAIRSQSNG